MSCSVKWGQQYWRPAQSGPGGPAKGLATGGQEELFPFPLPLPEAHLKSASLTATLQLVLSYHTEQVPQKGKKYWSQMTRTALLPTSRVAVGQSRPQASASSVHGDDITSTSREGCQARIRLQMEAVSRQIHDRSCNYHLASDRPLIM